MGVFDKQFDSVFTTYRATLQLRDKIMGGTPKDPKAIEGWLKKNAGLADGELRRATIRTLIENGVDLTENPTDDEINEAIASIASLKQTNGFKRDERGLYIEGRTVKAMLKESANIVFAGEKWGKRFKDDGKQAYAGKGARSFLAERVFVNPDRIYLGVQEPSGIELFIGHVMDKTGPKSTLTYVEFVERPTLEIEVAVLNNEITEQQWPRLWLHAQENGLGALRSQGFGRFDIDRWESATGRQPDTADRLLASIA
jgi:hypothetical protein